MNVPLISVVIPCYEQKQYLSDALASIEHQTYPHLEVIIVDDGSSTPITVPENVCTRFPVFLIRHQANRGLPTARNTGFRAARGEYVFPLDADDRIDPTLLEKLLFLLGEHPEKAYAYSHARLFGNETCTWCPGPYNFSRLLWENHICVASLIRKSVWEEVGGYDEHMRDGYEDWEFWVRLGKAGHHGVLLPEALFWYRRHRKAMLHHSRTKHRQIVQFIHQKHRDLFRPDQRFRIWLQWRTPVRGCSFSAFLKRLCPPFLIGPILTLRTKFLESGVLEPGAWKQHRLWCFFVVTPIALRKKANVLLHFPLFSLRTSLRIQPSTPEAGAALHVERRRTHQGSLQREHSSLSRNTILFLLPFLDHGGVGRLHLTLMDGLRAHGIDAVVVTTLPHTHDLEEAYRLHTPRIYHLTNLSQTFAGRLSILHHIITHHQPALLHLSNSEFGYTVLPRIRQSFPHLPIANLLHSDDLRGDYLQVSSRTRSAITKTYCISEYLRERLCREYGFSPSQIAILPPGIHIRGLLEKKKSGRAKTLAFIGRLSEEKRPLLFLKIAQELRKKEPFLFHFLLVGEGPLKGVCRRASWVCGLWKYLSILGHREDIERILSRADLLVNTSRVEGIPLTLLEAGAAGVPVVMPRLGGIPEVLRGNGILFNPHAPEREIVGEIAEKILKTDWRELQWKANHLRQDILRNFTAERMVERYVELYSQLITPSSTALPVIRQEDRTPAFV